MHNGSFTSVKDVVAYFNAGIPQDKEAGTAPTITSRFTHPRGSSYPQGLGLDRRDVRDLTDFIENALYDPAFVEYDPISTTELFQMSAPDLMYSVYRPELAALGANDGQMLSGLAEDNDDPLSRRDKGLEFLVVTDELDTMRISRSRKGNRQTDIYEISNNSDSVVDTHLLVVVRNLPGDTRLLNAAGMTGDGDPYIRIFLDDGFLQPADSIKARLTLMRRKGSPAIGYDLELLSGQGKP
jgi:hypothetical protein